MRTQRLRRNTFGLQKVRAQVAAINKPKEDKDK
nr:MAG TPA: hypothetical protein [Caudoviricetes sp.]